MKTKSATFSSIDKYIESFPVEVQDVMRKLRDVIHTAAPNLEEQISYNMPTFNLDGKYLVYFAGWKKHIAFYGAPRNHPDFDEDLTPYESGAGTLQFPLNQPIPYDLVTKIVKFQAVERQQQMHRK